MGIQKFEDQKKIMAALRQQSMLLEDFDGR
jgi:hypothetical protein